MHVLIRSVLATAMLVPFDAFFEETEAAGAAICSEYVNATRQLAAREQAAQCGIWGGFDQNKSRRWCVGVKDETVRDAMKSDRQKIGRCTTCRDYANAANQAARDNIAFRCGFTGDRWGVQGGGPDDGHFKWCMALSNTTKGFGMEYVAQISMDTPWDVARYEESSARDAGIKACIATARDRFSEREKSECEDYANTAVIMANFNANNKCGATTDGRWTLLKEPHFLWCLPRIGTNEGKAIVESETKVREIGAKACQAGGSLKPDGEVLWKGPPIRTLGKRPKRLDADQVKGKPEERPNFGGGSRPNNAVINNLPTGSGGASLSGNAMDRLGGSGNVPNLVPRPHGGSGGPTLAAPSGGAGKAGGSGAATTAPAVSAAPTPSRIGVDTGIDYGGAPPRTGAPIR